MGYTFQKLKFFYLLFLVCMTSFEAALLDHIMQIPRNVTRATTRVKLQPDAFATSLVFFSLYSVQT